MNTDNMSILGLTIDCGPYRWIDDYDPDWTPNTTDADGCRYRVGHQPQQAHRNLAHLAEALRPLFPGREPLEAGLEQVIQVYIRDWLQRYGAHLRQDGEAAEVRRVRMNAVNPRFVLRNYLAQEAADVAGQGDISRVHELLEVVRQLYAEQPANARFAALRPDWAGSRPGCSMLSCSS